MNLKLGFLKYLTLNHVLMSLLPLFVLILVFYFRTDIERLTLEQVESLLKGYVKQRVVTPYFVLQNYSEENIDYEYIYTLLNPQKNYVKSAEEKKVDLDNIELSFIYFGKDKYVIINGNLYREGDTSLEGFKIDRIEMERVKIIWGSTEKWLYIY